jgi:outer membrane protein TolC
LGIKLGLSLGAAFLKKRYFSTLLFISLCMQSCTDPTQRGLTSSAPGQEWVPACSEWYCEERLTSKPSVHLPEINEESDISSLLDTALRNHPVTRQAWAQARSKAYELGAAQSIYYPEIIGVEGWEWRDADSGSGSTTTATGSGDGVDATGNSGSFIPGTTQSVFWNLSIDYLLLDFGGRKATVEAAKQALYAVNWTQNRTIQEVIVNVIIGYYNYVSSKELVVAAESDLENAKTGLDSAEALFNAGVGKYLDVLQARSNVENIQLTLIQARGQVEIYLGQLATALGIPVSSKIDTKSLPEEFPMAQINADIDELLDIAKRNRPDLASAWATMLQRKNEIKIQWSDSLPTLTSSSFFEKTRFVRGSDLTTHNYNSVVQINIPIFRGFYYYNQIRRAREDYKAAKANYENLESLALLDVLTSYTNFISAQKELASSEEFLKYSAEAREVALGSYQAGTSNFLDLLTANSALAQAKAQNITARTKLAIALFNIAFTTGTLNVPYVSKSLSHGNLK